MTAAALIGARVSWRRYLAGLAAPAGFLLVGTLPILVSLDWQPGQGWPTLTMNGPAASQVFLRGLAATTCLVFFATTTAVPDLLALLRAARCPDHVVELMMLSYRFSLALVQTSRAIWQAQSLRLGDGSLAARFRGLALLASTLLPRSLEQGKRLVRGLETRGYDGPLPVLSLGRSLSWARVGTAVGLEVALAVLAVVELRGGL
jgi:cobalt/nickel transport system permease protein